MECEARACLAYAIVKSSPVGYAAYFGLALDRCHKAMKLDAFHDQDSDEAAEAEAEAEAEAPAQQGGAVPPLRAHFRGRVPRHRVHDGGGAAQGVQGQVPQGAEQAARR